MKNNITVFIINLVSIIFRSISTEFTLNYSIGGIGSMIIQMNLIYYFGRRFIMYLGYSKILKGRQKVNVIVNIFQQVVMEVMGINLAFLLIRDNALGFVALGIIMSLPILLGFEFLLGAEVNKKWVSKRD